MNAYWIPIILITGWALASCSDDQSSAVPSSPTGTALEPRDGLGETGYTVVDEVCDNTDASTYLKRFVTPMFRDIAVVGDTAFLVDGSLLWAVDISDPTAPERISLTRLTGTPKSLAASGDTLFAANGAGGILVIDVSEPETPRFHEALETLPGISLDVAVSRDTLYVAAGGWGLVTADISEPLEPVRLGAEPVPGFAAAVAVEGDFAYVAACAEAAVLDVSDPSAPALLSSVEIPDGHAREAAVEDGRLVISGGEALFLVDVRTPSAAEVIRYYTDYDAEGFYVNAAALRDGIAYIAAGDESFRAVDVVRMRPIDAYVSPSDVEAVLDLPVEVEPLGTLFIVNSDPIGIAVQDERLFVLGNFRWLGERLLRILDISSPYKSPVDLGKYTQPQAWRGIGATQENLLLFPADEEVIVADSQGESLRRMSLPKAVTKAVADAESTHLLLENGDAVRTADFESYSLIARQASDLAASDRAVFIAAPADNAVRGEAAGTPFTATAESLYLEEGFLGFARLFADGARLYAYDWAMGELHTARLTSTGALDLVDTRYIGECEAYDIADYFSGRDLEEAKMRPTEDGFAMLCPFDSFGTAQVIFFDLQDPDTPVIASRTELPAGRYGDFQIEGDTIYTVGFDNNAYRSTVQQIGDDDRIATDFDGAAVGIALLEDEIFVMDQDFGLRRYRPEDDTVAPIEPAAAEEAVR